MDASLTVQSIIEYFEEKLRHQEGYMSGSGSGSEPQYPMMVFHLGPDDGGAMLVEGLTRLWPQFRQEIPFLSAQPGAGGAEYGEFTLREDGKYAVSPITADRVTDLAAGLSSADNHFKSYDRIVAYFVVDTVGLNDPGGFDKYLDVVSRAESAMGIGNSMSMLLVLLDESNKARSELAKQIKNRLAEIAPDATYSICLLSNRRNDHRVAARDIRKLATAVIAVSNNRRVETVQDMFFNHRLFTAGYAREEKPTADICQFLVTALINRLSSLPPAGDGLATAKDLAQRLGISQNGTIVTLDEYARDKFASLLPAPQQLELFPRRDRAEFPAAPASMPASDFDEWTMGAWSAYLAGLVAEARAGLDLNRVEKERIAAGYRAYLRTSFTAGEFIWLSEHPERIDACFAVSREPIRQLGTLEYAVEYLKYLISSNEELRALCRGEVDRACREAVEYMADWNGLVRSMSTLHQVQQGDDFNSFYNGLFNDYYDRHAHVIEGDFKKTSSRDGLRTFFYKAVDGMLHDDAMSRALCASFESELRQRLGQDNVNNRVSHMLDPGQVPAYLQTFFSLGAPFRSFILLEAGSLSSALNIPAGTAVYNTGRGSAVEVLYLYALNPDNIMYGGAM